MLETVLGSNAGSFCCYALIELGLVLEDVDGDWTSAPHLVQLFRDAYYIRQLKAATIQT
jgi:hypothetical protein